MNNLDILPIKQEKTKSMLDIDPRLPDVVDGSILTLIAPPKSGKTVLLTNIFERKSLLKDAFDEIYIFSTTALNGDKSAKFLIQDDRTSAFNEYNDSMLQKILDEQMEYDDEDRPNIAIIFDDFLSFPNVKKNSLMFNLASMYRHYGIKLLVYSSQLYRALPPIVRQSTDYFIMFANGNAKEVEKIYDEIGSRYGNKKTFFNLLNEATKKKYNFLYLDLYNRPALAYRNFNHLLMKAPITFNYDDLDI